MLDTNRLSTQLIIAFIAIVLLTAATVGLPAIWLLQSQLDQQAWSQVEQGQRAAIGLYSAQYREILNLATLTAQRPTLKELLVSGDIPGLTDYLYTLKAGAGLTRIIICDPHDQIIATTDEAVPESICQKWQTGNYQHNPNIPQACLTAYQPIETESGVLLGNVFVCNQLDDAFATQISEETGLEHTLWIDDLPVSTSFDVVDIAKLGQDQHVVARRDGRTSHHTFKVNGIPYYSAHLPLEADGLSAEVALDITEIQKTRDQLARTFTASILGVSLVGSLLGVVLSRRISRPLVRLAQSAEAFSRGDLQAPVDTNTHLREVAQVAQALESARTDLLEILTRLQSERDWSDHLLASIVEGIITLDGEGRITFFSQGAERITGWERTQVLGQLCDTVFQLNDRHERFTRVIPDPGGRGKADVRLADGQVASLAITRAELAPSNADEVEIALVFRDISEEEAVHRILGHFLANVAHEFRTPLAALAASIELLLDQAPDLTSDELHELLISLHLGTLGLQTLVDNLLESASLEAGRFHISPRTTDLGDIVAEAVRTMQPLLSKYEQNLTVELPAEIPQVYADPRRTVQVLVNLLGNASKYGPPEAEIQLKVTLSNDQVRISVLDQGPGIPPEARADIFHRFIYPEGEPDHSQAGAGLGLSVVKAIVEAHNGQVGVDDRPGGGAIFWFTLTVVKDAG
jgi:PAS domain S-box-containing protein